MQVDNSWKAAANLQLLLGESHPPVRIDHSPVLSPAARMRAMKQEASDRAGVGPTVLPHGQDAFQEEPPLVDARNTVNFRSATFCGLQDPRTPTVRHTLAQYYKAQLNRIALWRESRTTEDDSVKAEQANGDGSATAVKEEPPADDDEGAGPSGGGDLLSAQSGQTAQNRADTSVSGGAGRTTSTYRALGILTQVHDPIGDQELLPWEFYVVPDPADESCYEGVLAALLKDVPQNKFPLLSHGMASANVMEGRPSDGGAQEPSNLTEDEASAQSALDHHRLSLYPRMMKSFSGLYPGAAVGIIGEPFQRSARGVLTGVLLRDIVLPHRPLLPWRVDRPLSLQGPRSPAPGAGGGLATGAVPTRVHFCSGPFPRRDIAALLRAVTRQALHRGADVLIVGGPLIKPFEEFEREVMPSLDRTFSECLEGFLDTIEETMQDYYAARPNVPHMKVVLVSHRDDVTQVPVLPTAMYAVEDTEDVCCRSNPCRIAVNGVHFAVCNEDVVGRMRDAMVERWPTAEGSLRRVVEALVQSRCYTPVTELPLVSTDMKHFTSLRMDYLPEDAGLLTAQKAPALPVTRDSRNWSVALGMATEEQTSRTKGETAKKEETDDLTGVARSKRAKTEPSDDLSASVGSSTTGTEAKTLPLTAHSAWESFPHVMFLPSSRPQFAYVTHRGVCGHRGESTAAGLCGDVEDESSLDDVKNASGVLVVNQEVWSRRSAARFQLRVAEVTIPDSAVVAARGASASNGVACGVLHVFHADSN